MTLREDEAERIEAQPDFEPDRPDDGDLPHRTWKCDRCGVENSYLDIECQFCEDPLAGLMTLKTFLENQGKTYPEKNLLTDEDFKKLGIPMVVSCTACQETFVAAPNIYCNKHGQVFCYGCAGVDFER